ncbi:MAG TPA: hypothetical protein VKR59_19060 [Terriglobales bacterium]|nr:hypothetical protein [Terriglobales bacterium]
MRKKILIIVLLAISGATVCLAAGPAFVAGSGYNAGVEGQAMVWANGSVQYFTDQGNLSPILAGAQADTIVASAFTTWTSISGVALSASQGGHLAEDVNGSNIAVNASGTITSPADITPSATGTPVGIVYDFDGTVTDALLGEGAGGVADCFTNAVYGGPDNFALSGKIVHAVVVINGVCATTSSQLPDVQYRLVRVLGRILGMGWSQANLNVLTRKPPPTSDDFAGFPVMHFADPISCVPITACYANPSTPKMDDANSLVRLYPGAGSGRPTGRIYGGLYFTDAAGNAQQPMQGVNVVARLLDGSGNPSRQFVATSVSGSSFVGNAGNIIDGYVDANGLRFDRWGSNDPLLEGFFDLGQLPIPAGQNIALYQLSVEALDANWSLGVEPYAPTQVAPSGAFSPVVVTIENGSNIERDILMLQSEIASTHPGSGSTYAAPVGLPQGGGWGSWISGYGSSDWFEFSAQANRTASVSVTALDETGAPSESKLLPVIGIWQLSDTTGNPAPSSTLSAFNSNTFGMTRLDSQFLVSDSFRIGVADYRGDGRPDYFYRASLLYSDTVAPARISLAGGLTMLTGIGFSAGLEVSVAGNAANPISTSASHIAAVMPPGAQDGTATILVADPVTGGFSQMINALTYGALGTDLLLLLQGSEPATPVGAPAANPIRVRAVADDGVTAVNGATIAWSATNGLQFSICGGTSSCSVLTDEAGESSSLVTPTSVGQSTITIALAPESYSPPQTQQATVVATSTSLDLVALTPTRWVAQGSTIAVPLTVEALDLGVPTANVAIKFRVTNGSATLSSASGTTNALGLATTTAQLTNLSAAVQVSACVSPNNAPCQTFTMFSTPASVWKLETVSGSAQVVPVGEIFAPLVMRVTDGSAASNPVMGANVAFTTTLGRAGPDPVILGSSQAVAVSDGNGLAVIVPSVGSVGACDVFITVTAGIASVQMQMESVTAVVPSGPDPKTPPGARGSRFIPIPNTVETTSSLAPAAALFAVPQGVPLDNPAANQSTCSEAAQDVVATADSTGNPQNGGVVSRICDPAPKTYSHSDSSTSDAGVPKAPPKPPEKKAPDTAKRIGVDKSTAPKDSSSSRGLPGEAAPVLREDQRGCRELAGNGLFF